MVGSDGVICWTIGDGGGDGIGSTEKNANIYTFGIGTRKSSPGGNIIIKFAFLS